MQKQLRETARRPETASRQPAPSDAAGQPDDAAPAQRRTMPALVILDGLDAADAQACAVDGTCW